MKEQASHVSKIRFWLYLFMIGLLLSGITAFPLQAEIGWFVTGLQAGWLRPIAESTHLLAWVEQVNAGLRATNAQYPFLAYGTDWLAFAHITIAVFYWPFRGSSTK